MAFSVNDLVQEQGLDYVKQNVTHLVICEGEPATHADASTDKGSGGNRLADIAIDATEVTLTTGDVSGRKAVVGAQSNISVNVSGTADHLALRDDNGGDLLLVTEISPSSSVSAGGAEQTESFDVEIQDP